MPPPDQPLVSFVLLAYNQEAFIREAVEGAFSQTYSPLEIILSDDCSKDRTFEIIQEMAATYHGPHKIVLNRNPKNLGIGQHYNRIMELASGEIVELAAGDDISLPWRTADSVLILKDHPDITCVSLGIQHFQDDPTSVQVTQKEITNMSKWSLQDYVRPPSIFINAPGRAFRKFTHDYFGPLINQCPVEDGPNLLRCLIHGRAASCEKVGVLYRWNDENISNPKNIVKIPFSAIYADYLNTTQIAFNRKQIDLPTYQELASAFERQRARYVILEKVNGGTAGFLGVLRIVCASCFTLKERIKLVAKAALCALGLRKLL